MEPGYIIAIIDAGQISMPALLTAQFYSPAKIYVIDIDENRSKMTKKFSAIDTIKFKKRFN